MSVSVTFWGNLADAAYQLRETRFAESLLDGVVRSVAHCDRAADSFCAHIGGQVAAVAIVSRDHHQVVLADRRRLDCDHDLAPPRSEEHTSELQSRSDLVCRLLLEKKKK